MNAYIRAVKSQGQEEDFLNTDFNLVMKQQKKEKQSKEELIRPSVLRPKQKLCRHCALLCSSFQFDVLMNCGNSDPAHPSYPHGRLKAVWLNTAVKLGKEYGSFC